MRKTVGKTNAYILNLMTHYDTQAMNEYALKDRLNKEFHYHLRANEVRKLHIEPLISNHWLIQIKGENGEIYTRIGPITYVTPEETLGDQFQYDEDTLLDAGFFESPEEMRERAVLHYSDPEVIKEIWEEDPYSFMTEKEYDEFWNRKWEEHLKEEKMKRGILIN